MMKYGFIVWGLILVSCGARSKATLKIASAANLQGALDSISQIFERDFDVSIEITYASSGLLFAQIKEGAQYDLYISANVAYPEKLSSENLSETAISFCSGELVMVYPENNIGHSIQEIFTNEQVKFVGIPDPETAPFGIAAMNYLKNQDWFSENKNKIVVGENVQQINQWLLLRTVDIGFTSRSFIATSHENWNYSVIPTAVNLNQTVCKIKHTNENHEKADDFINFLTSSTAKAILIHFGYH